MENQNTHSNGQTKDNKPEYKLYLIREFTTGDQWAEVGVGWRNQDGEGISFISPLLKMFGFKIVARTIKPKN